MTETICRRSWERICGTILVEKALQNWCCLAHERSRELGERHLGRGVILLLKLLKFFYSWAAPAYIVPRYLART